MEVQAKIRYTEEMVRIPSMANLATILSLVVMMMIVYTAAQV